MTLYETIRARRAVRSYTTRTVDEATIRTLLDAAVWAPSAMNTQQWEFAVVQDPKQLERYSTRAKAMLLEVAKVEAKVRHYEEMLRNEGFNIFYDATTLIVIGCAERGPYAEADCWLAAENLMLTACDAGLGTCCIGFAVPILNTDEVKAELRLSPGGAAVAPILVGYPSSKLDPIPRKDPKIVSWSHPAT